MRIAALSVCLALIGFVQPLVAETRNGSVWQDGVLYSYSVCSGGATIVDVEFDRPIFGEYMVPSTLDGYPVVGIKGGFNIGRSFSSVTISDGVKVISGGVFSGCSMLEKVTLPKTLIEIGGIVFSQCTNLTEIAIPNSVTTIEQNPFQGCSALGTGLVVIDGWAVGFNGIVPKSVEIPEGVESIAGDLFASQTNLTSITLPSTLRHVGRRAFSGCTGLGNGLIVRDGWVLAVKGEIDEDVALPEGTVGLADSVFWNVSSVRSVNIPESVKYIGAGALTGTSITNIDVAAHNGDYCSRDGVLFSKDIC